MDGTTELPQTKLGEFKKFHIKYRGLNKLIKKHDIISFDLYDTLIYRGCSKPKDVFHTLDFFAKKFLNLKIDLCAQFQTVAELEHFLDWTNSLG